MIGVCRGMLLDSDIVGSLWSFGALGAVPGALRAVAVALSHSGEGLRHRTDVWADGEWIGCERMHTSSAAYVQQKSSAMRRVVCCVY